MEKEKLLTAAETAGLLGISVASIKNWEKHGLLKTNTAAGRCGYSRKEVELLLEKIRSGEVNRLNRRANKKHTRGGLLPAGELRSICESLTTLVLPLADIMYLISRKLFSDAGCRNSAVIREHMSSFATSSSGKQLEEAYYFIDSLPLPSLPPAELDTAGIIYQSLCQRGKRARSGSFYTPPETADRMLQSAVEQLAEGGRAASALRFIDPCCGTGQFMLSFIKAGGSAENAAGIDADPIACFVARTNILLQSPEAAALPAVRCTDSLLSGIPDEGYYDLAATNPPWGACTIESRQQLAGRYPDITSGESFSYFISRCLELITPGGIASFVLPESITNVKRHKDVRRLMLERSRINSITGRGRLFKDVYTPVVTIEMTKTLPVSEASTAAAPEGVRIGPDLSFNININTKDAKIIDRVFDQPHITLKDNAEWALGIVTGSNDRFISRGPGVGLEPVIKGSDILPGEISPPIQFIRFEPAKFQQTAPERKYRCRPKLVYRFISKKLVFAVDLDGRLTLNSANIIIPGGRLGAAGWDCERLSMLFNSELCNFIYMKMFNSVKVLRGNLEQLPLPLPCNTPERPGSPEDLAALTELFSENELDYIRNQSR